MFGSQPGNFVSVLNLKSRCLEKHLEVINDHITQEHGLVRFAEGEPSLVRNRQKICRMSMKNAVNNDCRRLPHPRLYQEYWQTCSILLVVTKSNL